MLLQQQATAARQDTIYRRKALSNGATGQCDNRLCGAILYDEPVDVPNGWIIRWHVNCGDYCPECALVLKEGDGEKARLILAVFSGSDSNKELK